jgi:hypothetical protein
VGRLKPYSCAIRQDLNASLIVALHGVLVDLYAAGVTEIEL